MKRTVTLLWLLGVCLSQGVGFAPAQAAAAPISETSQACIDCHATLNPGIVEGWKQSRHAKITPAEAIQKEKLARRVSADPVPDWIAGVAVGCAECHLMNAEIHGDTFNHMDYPVHTVVTPTDCAVCHPDEEKQYRENVMSWAHEILARNDLYLDLMNHVAGTQTLEDGKLVMTPPNEETKADACYFCHGTVIEVGPFETRETVLGDFLFPTLRGWPNQGVGRINPDRSRGSCSACHTRHRFSIEMARDPYTCAECHKGPDVPAYKVYAVSKHGATHATHSSEWDMEAVPWTVGEDFTAPTCATCHVSLLVDTDGEVVAERTHAMKDRLDWRIFGLVYAHPQPKSPKTFEIKNAGGLPLPTELTGEPVAEFLIDSQESRARRQTMQKVCLSCHATSWVDGHFARLDNSIEMTNQATLTATEMLFEAWSSGIAEGPSDGGSPFDETFEKMWADQWLFYANSTRFASAMAGADYGVFADGRYHLSKNLQEMRSWIDNHRSRVGR